MPKLQRAALALATACLIASAPDPTLAQPGTLHPITRAYPEDLRDPFTHPISASRPQTVPPVLPPPRETCLRPRRSPGGLSFTLAGVVQSETGATALIVEGGQTRMVGQGARLGKCRILRIGARSVRMEGPDGPFTLELGLEADS